MSDSIDPIRAFREAETAAFSRAGLAPPREHTFTFAAQRMRTIDAGAIDGAPTLYVHGGGACGAMWTPLIGSLDQRRRHVAPDRPGFGLSEFVELDGRDFRRHAVDFLVATLDALKIDRPVDVVANSMGGLWSLWLALDRPERVKSLALIGAPAFVGGGSAPMPLRLLGRPVIGPLMMKLESPSPKQVRVLWERMGHAPAKIDDTVHDLMLALELLPQYATSWRALIARVLTMSGPRADVVLSDAELAKVRCPITWMWGSADPFGDVALGRKAARGAPFTIAGTGHLPWLDDASACARAIEALWQKDGARAAA